MTIQIQTVTLADGSKLDVIRDVKKVRELVALNAKMRAALRHIARWTDDGELLERARDALKR